MTDTAPAPATLGQMAAAFPASMPAVQQIGALLGAIVPGSPILLLTREPSGKVFSFSPRSSIGEAAAMLSDALGSAQDSVEPAVSWPMLKVSFGDSLGSASQHADAPMTPKAFTTILFDQIAIDTHGGFDRASGYYTAPQGGLYDVSLLFRIADGDLTGVSYGTGVGTANADSPEFVWHDGAPMRQSASCRSLLKLAKGDLVRAFYYLDGAPVNYTAAELTILRIR